MRRENKNLSALRLVRLMAAAAIRHDGVETTVMAESGMAACRRWSADSCYSSQAVRDL
jgi:hypothetical protein